MPSLLKVSLVVHRWPLRLVLLFFFICPMPPRPRFFQLVAAINAVKKDIRDIVAPGTTLEPVATLRRSGSFTRSQARRARAEARGAASAPAAPDDRGPSQEMTKAASASAKPLSASASAAAASFSQTQAAAADDVIVVQDEEAAPAEPEPERAAVRSDPRPQGDALLKLANRGEPAAKVARERRGRRKGPFVFPPSFHLTCFFPASPFCQRPRRRARNVDFDKLLDPDAIF